jgi:transcriptional regulator with XRE-family HTH domain
MAKPKTAKTIGEVVEGKWTAKQLAVIVHLANPRGGTQRELAKKLKVDEATISDWKQLQGFMEDVHRVAAVYFLEADLQVDRANLRDALQDPVANPDAANAILKARELYYKRRGLLVDKRQLTGADGGPISVSHEDGRITSLLSEYSDDELGAIIEAASGGVAKKRRRGKASQNG